MREESLIEYMKADGYSEAEIDEIMHGLGMTALYYCAVHSPRWGLFGADPDKPDRLVCGCKRPKSPVAYE